MSNQVEQIRAEVERRIKSWQAGVKYEGDAGDCQSRVTELTDLKKFIDSLPAEENPILVPEPKETTIEAERPIQGSIAPASDVNRWAVTNAFLHCEKAGKIVSEMYGDKLNNPRNRDKYIAFLQQVNLDDRFGELAGILQRYGAMQEQKEQPEVDLEKLGEIARHLIAVKQHIEDMRLSEDEWSLIERIGYPERFNAKK